jgi:hypothetical protein
MYSSGKAYRILPEYIKEKLSKIIKINSHIKIFQAFPGNIRLKLKATHHSSGLASVQFET